MPAKASSVGRASRPHPYVEHGRGRLNQLNRNRDHNQTENSNTVPIVTTAVGAKGIRDSKVNTLGRGAGLAAGGQQVARVHVSPLRKPPIARRNGPAAAWAHR